MFGKENNKLKVTLKDQNVKNIAMEKKKNLKIPIYINHDLTPEEKRMEKSIKELGKRLTQEEKKDRYGHPKAYVDGIPHKVDSSNKVLVFPTGLAASSHVTFKHNKKMHKLKWIQTIAIV